MHNFQAILFQDSVSF